MEEVHKKYRSDQIVLAPIGLQHYCMARVVVWQVGMKLSPDNHFQHDVSEVSPAIFRLI